MDTTLALPRHRRVLRAITAGLTGMLLATSVVTAQESPPPEASTDPAETQPGAAEPGAAQPRRWALAAMPDRPAGWILNDVIAGGPGFIAVGGGSRGRPRSVPEALIWVSDSGRAFQSVPLFGVVAEGTIRAIAATTDGFVAVGDGADGAAVWVSDDGIGWQRVPHSAVFDESVMLDVANGPVGLVAVGCQGTIDCATSRAWRSADGMTWESLDSAPPGVPFAIEATDDGYLVAGRQPPGAAPMVASSTDGQTWQLAQGLPPGPAGLASLGTFEGALAGGSTTESGANRAMLLRSTDGAAWQALSHRSFRAADFADMASSPGGVLLLGTRTQPAGGNLRSRPLALWTTDLQRFRLTPFPAQSTRAGGEVNAAVFSADGGLIVAVGATARPAPTVWFSRMATPRARGDRRAQGGDETPTASPAPDAPAPTTAPPAEASAAPPSEAPSD